MDDDICDKNSINELESILYSQIHHDPADIADNIDIKSITKNSDPKINNEPPAPIRKDRISAGKKINPIAKLKAPQDVSKLDSNPNSIARPKPFTPYTSYLAQIDSPPLAVSDKSNIIITNKPENSTTTASDGQLSDKKPKNRMLNPFSQKNQDKRSNAEKIKKKRQRAAKNRKFKKPSIISLSSNDEIDMSDDDDVIILPSQPISIYSIDDSSDDDDAANKQNTENNSEQNQSNDNVVKTSCSPTPSSASADDYIGQGNLNRTYESNEALGDIDDFELNVIRKTVEKMNRSELTEKLHSTEHVSECQYVEINNDDDDASFIKPTTTKASTSNQSYEVTDNSFAAIDVYESESSDMPDTVYAMKQLKKSEPKTQSDSECSDIIFETENRSKRFKKRKNSSSTKGSDHQDENTDDDDDNVSDIPSIPMEGNMENSTNCIVRGEAIANAVTDVRKISKTKLKKRKNLIEQTDQCQSDEEFISMLSTVVHSEFKNKKFPGYSEMIAGPQKPISPIPIQKSSTEWIVTEHKNNLSPKIGKTNVVPDNNNIEINILDGNICLDVGPSGSKKDIQFTDINLTDKNSTKATAIGGGNTINNSESKIKGKSVVSCSLGVDPEIGWNEEMKYFYNKSWGGETHDTSAMQRAMTNNSFEWALISDDKYSEPIRVNKNLRCINCREIGHRTHDCNLPRKEITCYMCGQNGHREPRCPNSLCLRCGSKTNVFLQSCKRCANFTLVCRLCNTSGHSAKNCSDKWRRYHSTTKPNACLTAYTGSNAKSLYRKLQFCSICSGRGHLAEHCKNAVKILQFPVTPMEIKSYNKTYLHTPVTDETSPDYVPYAMISAPKLNFNFNWDVDESPNRFYGRFMKSTNFQRKPLKVENDDKTPINISSDLESMFVLNPMSAGGTSKKLRVTKRGGRRSKSKRLQNVQQEQVIVDKIFDGIADVEESEYHPTDPKDSEFNCDDIKDDDNFMEDKIGTLSNNNDTADTSKENDTTNEEIHQIDAKETNDNNIIAMESLIDFSFTKAIDELEMAAKKAKKTFDLSFINAKTCNTISPALRNSQKLLKIFSQNCRAQEKELDAAATASSITMARTRDSPDSTYSFSEFFHTDQTPSDNKQTIVNDYDDEAPRKIPVLDSSTPTKVEQQQKKYKWTNNKQKPETIQEPYQKIPVIDSRNSSIIKFDDDDKMPEYISLEHYDDDQFYNNIKLPRANANNSTICSGISLEIAEEESTTPTPTANIRISTTEFTPKCDAKIYLTKDHTKYLTNDKGTEFLRDASSRNNVTVLMGYESIGNFLNVNGFEAAQNSFHNELINYFKEAEKLMKEKNAISQRVPKQRHTLIKFIKDQLLQLDRSLGNVQYLYKCLKNYEKQNSKTGASRADKCRKTLNMILVGQAGLLDGQMHLTALQTNLRYLMESVRDIVSPNFRNQVFQHCRYLFSSYDHKEYDIMVKEYTTMKTNNQLPTINLDRKLLGLKINIKTNAYENDDEMLPDIPPAPTGLELQEAKQKLQMSLTSSSSATTPTKIDSIDLDTKTIAQAKNKLQAFIKATDTDKNVTNVQQSGKESVKKRSTTDSSNSDNLMKTTFKKLSQVVSTTTEKKISNAKDSSSSALWSRKCLECIEKINAMPSLLDGVKKYNFDLDRLERKATENKLSYTHYRLLLNYCYNEQK